MIVLWYIWIVGRAYLGTGLIVALILWLITFDKNEINKITLKELVFTIFLYPIVIYYFIKELENGNRSK